MMNTVQNTNGFVYDIYDENGTYAMTVDDEQLARQLAENWNGYVYAYNPFVADDWD